MGILIVFIIGCLVLLGTHLLWCFTNDEQVVPDSILERLPKQYFVAVVLNGYRDYSGKPLPKGSNYRICRKCLWYTDYATFDDIRESKDLLIGEKVECTWKCSWGNRGTVFSCKEDAETILQDIINNPAKYKFYYGN